MRKMPLLAALILLGPLAVCAKMYKWTDSEGNVHYTQKPPPENVSGEELKAMPKTSFGETPPADEPQKAENQTTSPPSDDISQLTPEQLQQRNCEKAKANHEALKNNTRVVITGEDNKLHELSESERQAKLEQAQQFVDKYCNITP